MPPPRCRNGGAHWFQSECMPLKNPIFSLILSIQNMVFKSPMKKTFTLLPPTGVWAFLLILFSGGFAGAQHAFPTGFAETRITGGLNPTAMAFSPDGRLFICDKSGRIHIVRNDEFLTTPFVVLPNVDDFNERGLGGIAFDPDFANNGYVYLYYAVKDANHNRIVRLKASGDAAVPGSEEILVELEPMAGTIHNGGAMAFGPDGKLYVSIGDGANSGSAQSMDSKLGKFLRINADGSIPTDNPFYNSATGTNRAIWALGFRNSFTFAIQPGTGRIFANDVGGSLSEEINEVVKGGNYGWNQIEGPKPANTAPPANYRDPVYAYDHGLGCSIIGAAFCDAATNRFPAIYAGKYFFADYCNGYIKVLNPANGQIESTFATGINRPVDFEFAKDGSLYYLERAGMGGGSMQDNTSTNNGALWKLTYTGSGAPGMSQQPASVLVSAGDSAVFFVAASGSRPLTFQWQRDGNNIAGATQSSHTFKNAALADNNAQLRCVVTNAFGSAASHAAALQVTADKRPVPTITTPLAGATYRAGDTLAFAGTVLDNEDGNLPDSAYTWWVDFHHDSHAHPGLSPVKGIRAGQFAVPRFGEISDNVWYRIHLRAIDSKGLSQTTFTDVYPQKTTLKLETEPAGIGINLDGEMRIAPYEFNSVKGITRIVEAPVSYAKNNNLYVFKQWSGGAAGRILTFATPDVPTTYRAIFDVVPLGTGSGLTGKYYDNGRRNFTVPVTVKRLDANIDFTWGNNSPDPKIKPDNFTASWSGLVQPLFSEEYTFYATADDGVRLWVDNKLLVDKWQLQAATEWQGTVTLEAGKKYELRLDYFEELYDAVVKLAWSSRRTPKQIIPATQLYPLEFVTATEPLVAAGGFTLYPVPAGDILKVKIVSLKTAKADVSVYNTLGQKLLQTPQSLRAGENTFEINTQNLAPGMYLITVSGPSGPQSKAFVKR